MLLEIILYIRNEFKVLWQYSLQRNVRYCYMQSYIPFPWIKVPFSWIVVSFPRIVFPVSVIVPGLKCRLRRSVFPLIVTHRRRRHIVLTGLRRPSTSVIVGRAV